MTVTGLIMAGGKGARMSAETEKPLLKIAGKPMILYVVDALRRSKEIDNIIVTTSQHAPRTAQALRLLGIKVFESPGKDYVEDTQLAVKSLGLGKTLVVSADLPLITSDFINEVIHRYEVAGKPALTVAYPRSLGKKSISEDNERLDYRQTELISAGINVLDGKWIDEKQLDEEVMVTDNMEVVLNVNTSEDLELAKHMLHKTQSNRRE
jgi:adenosylcobinamide-phosphate guanylyltransferase